MKRLMILVALLSTSCSSLYDEDEQFKREYNRAMAELNWETCVVKLKSVGRSTIHVDHTHAMKRRITDEELRGDLWRNKCRQILGDEWSDYLE